jgi:hypothetical protein
MSNTAQTVGTAGSVAVKILEDLATEYSIPHATSYNVPEQEAKAAEQKNQQQAESWQDRFRAALLDEAQQETAFTPPDFLIHNFLPAGAVGTLAGHAGAGKSTWLVHLCRSINRGMPLAMLYGKDGAHREIPHGEPRKTGNCVIITSEDPQGIANRRRSWDRFHDSDGDLKAGSNFQTYVFRVTPDLTSTIQLAALRKILEEVKPVVVAVDTLGAMLAEAAKDRRNADSVENNNPIITRLYNICAELCQGLQTTLIFTHHPSKGGDPLRGAYGILASSRFVLLLKQEEGAVKVHCHKANDFDKNAVSFSHKLESATLATTEDGHPVALPVIASGRPVVSATKRLLALQCLVTCMADGSAPTREWQQAMATAGISGYRNMRAKLTGQGYVEGVGKKRNDQTFPAYKLTKKGEVEVAADLPVET